MLSARSLLGGAFPGDPPHPPPHLAGFRCPPLHQRHLHPHHPGRLLAQGTAPPPELPLYFAFATINFLLWLFNCNETVVDQIFTTAAAGLDL